MKWGAQISIAKYYWLIHSTFFFALSFSSTRGSLFQRPFLSPPTATFFSFSLFSFNYYVFILANKYESFFFFFYPKRNYLFIACLYIKVKINPIRNIRFQKKGCNRKTCMCCVPEQFDFNLGKKKIPFISIYKFDIFFFHFFLNFFFRLRHLLCLSNLSFSRMNEDWGQDWSFELVNKGFKEYFKEQEAKNLWVEFWNSFLPRD